MTHGRSAWTNVGMPANATGMYQLLHPITVGSQPHLGLSYRAVNYGVKVIQTRVNELGYRPLLKVDGDFGPQTSMGLIWAQHLVGVASDGQAGPHTMLAFLWPFIKERGGTNAQVVGSICHLESGFDPGAVGYVVDNDLGLAQINLPSNPRVTEAEAFEYHFSLSYLASRIAHALASYSNRDAAIVSYNSPLWAQEWQAAGHAPNSTAQQYVDLVLAWTPPAA